MSVAYLICPNPQCGARVAVRLDLIDSTVICSRCSQLFYVKAVAIALSDPALGHSPQSQLQQPLKQRLEDRHETSEEKLLKLTHSSPQQSKKRCICGSQSHQRTSHLSCPLNAYNRKQRKARMKSSSSRSNAHRSSTSTSTQSSASVSTEFSTGSTTDSKPSVSDSTQRHSRYPEENTAFSSSTAFSGNSQNSISITAAAPKNPAAPNPFSEQAAQSKLVPNSSNSSSASSILQSQNFNHPNPITHSTTIPNSTCSTLHVVQQGVNHLAPFVWRAVAPASMNPTSASLLPPPHIQAFSDQARFQHSNQSYTSPIHPITSMMQVQMQDQQHAIGTSAPPPNFTTQPSPLYPAEQSFHVQNTGTTSS